MTEGEQRQLQRIAQEFENAEWPLNEQQTNDLGFLLKIAVAQMPRFNGGIECDMVKGPCACGAWH